jgi:hypothetical protein
MAAIRFGTLEVYTWGLSFFRWLGEVDFPVFPIGTNRVRSFSRLFMVDGFAQSGSFFPPSIGTGLDSTRREKFQQSELC